MKKAFFSLLLCIVLLIPGCGSHQANTDSAYQIACTTYPVYLMTQAVTEDIEDVTVTLVIDQQVSCLHNYTLTMRDMEAVERADILIENGAGLEDFLEDVLEERNVIDASADITLLDSEEHEDHHDHDDHDHDQDPHIWMDPRNAARMAQNIAAALAAADPGHADQYLTNGASAAQALTEFYDQAMEQLGGASYDLITFHDGFAYFAEAFGMNLLAAVEEEEGSEASAKTIKTIAELVTTYRIPAVFTETNGSDATAQTICRECSISTYPLSMCMSGAGGGIAAYEAVIQNNIDIIMEAYQ